MESPPVTTLEELLSRASRLYSLPAVAMEVVRLTDEPRVDVRALRDCVARDTALTAKLLRVVNSSVYGLRGEVGDLNQAIALLGVTPLKLLVLGFSLPDQLLDDVSAEALRGYWTDTLTRAAAARAIARVGWGSGEDEAQLAALLQGVGQLVLLSQLGEPYARVVERFEKGVELGAGDEASSLATVEAEAIGFDHRTLSAELLRDWSIPGAVADAIALQAEPERIAETRASLPKVLRLAELLAQLVGRRRLFALPALVGEGLLYCELSRRQINSLVEGLQQDVEQLAEAMQVDLVGEHDFRQTLVDAHAQLAIDAEDGVTGLLRANALCGDASDDDRLCVELLGESRRLGDAVRDFLMQDEEPPEAPDAAPGVESHAGRATPRRPHHHATRGGYEQLLLEAARLAGECRTRRTPLSLVIAEVEPRETIGEARPPWAELKRWLAGSHWAEESLEAVFAPLSGERFGVLLPGVERGVATKLLNQAGDDWHAGRGAGFDAGVASVTLVSKGFDVSVLVAAAERCLSAAQDSATAAVKSIEVY